MQSVCTDSTNALQSGVCDLYWPAVWVAGVLTQELTHGRHVQGLLQQTERASCVGYVSAAAGCSLCQTCLCSHQLIRRMVPGVLIGYDSAAAQIVVDVCDDCKWLFVPLLRAILQQPVCASQHHDSGLYAVP